MKIKEVFFLDHTSLQAMFEGNKVGKEMTKKMNEIKYAGKELCVITTKSCFLRALFISKSEVTIHEVQKVLNILDVGPSKSDFKDEKAVTDEILKIVGGIGEYFGGDKKVNMDCPNCGEKNDKHKNLTGETDIKDGDISFCHGCGMVSEFKDRKLVKLDEKDLDDEEKKMINKIRKLWKKDRGKKDE